MSSQKKKMTEKEKREKIKVETEVPNPPVPNRAWTEMSTKPQSLSDKLKQDREKDRQE